MGGVGVETSSPGSYSTSGHECRCINGSLVARYDIRKGKVSSVNLELRSQSHQNISLSQVGLNTYSYSFTASNSKVD